MFSSRKPSHTLINKRKQHLYVEGPLAKLIINDCQAPQPFTKEFNPKPAFPDFITQTFPKVYTQAFSHTSAGMAIFLWSLEGSCKCICGATLHDIDMESRGAV